MSKRLLNVNNFNFLAVFKFYSRIIIVLNKLCSETKKSFRASENNNQMCINIYKEFLKTLRYIMKLGIYSINLSIVACLPNEHVYMLY